MITVNNLNIQYGTKHLFRNVNASIYDGDRIGLVGVNGAGKSTLLKIIAGVHETDQGTVVRAKNASMGYLPQEVSDIDSRRTLFKEAMSAFDPLLRMQKEIDELNRQLASTPADASAYDSLVARHGDLQHRLEQADIYGLRSQVEKVLVGLGFQPSDFERECRTFSGGWLMRLMLAKLLLARPACLLLDEPTNHLDLESLTWLETFLQNYPGAMVIISHDRAFLDNMTTTTWELSLGNLAIYKGNYSQYVKDRDARQAIVRASYENQQAFIQQTMRFVERFRAKSTKAKQVQSRLKRLEKMELIELEADDKSIRFRFPPAEPSGRHVLHVGNVTRSYGDLVVIRRASFDLQRGDKVAVVGVNGAGKSTLVRLVAGLLRPDGGEIRLGHNVRSSYFGQHQAQELDQSLTVDQTISLVEGERTVTQNRSLLGAFLFSGDDVNKKVGILSGGEKSRLALAKMIASPANLLIMDEPTNHLDMASQEILQEALSQYDGTVIIVSHNRSFVDGFINRVLEVRDGKATLHEGTIREYLARRRSEEEAVGLASSRGVEEKDGKPRSSRKEERQKEARQRQERSRELAPLRKKVEEAEAEIDHLEGRKKALEQALADPELYRRPDDFADTNREYQDVARRLERTIGKWEEALERVEEIEAKYNET